MTFPLPAGRWLGVALIASLALNAFFIGAAATDVLTAGRGDHRDGKMRFELRWLASRLPDDVMAKVEAAVSADQSSAEAHLDRLRDLRADLGLLLSVPQPDRAAVDARLAEIRAELDNMVAESQAVTIDALLGLPAATRASLADDPSN
jgi:hypothetical protein